jgi:peptidoglycan hydrolase CwlO-like protein
MTLAWIAAGSFIVGLGGVMSQTETLLFMALGAVVTLLLVLLFGRVFWNLAVAAATRHRAKQVPVEMLNLQADRDRLRAEHALMARKLELRLDDIKLRMAEQMAEVSRSRNRVQGLLQDIATRDEAIRKLERENGVLSSQLQLKTAELDSAQRAADLLQSDIGKQSAEIAKLNDGMQKLGSTLRNKDALVGQLNEELRGLLALPATAAEGEALPAPHAGGTEGRLRRRVAELTSISAEMSRADAASTVAAASAAPDTPPDPSLAALEREQAIQKKLAEAERETEEMQKELRALDEMLAKVSSPHEQPVEAQPKKQGAMANVVSLAQRIRALQHGIND